MASSHVPVPAPLAASPVHVPVPDPASAPEPTPMAPMAPFPVLVPSAPLAPLAPLPTFGVVSFASSPPDPPLPGPGHHLLFVGVLVNGILTKALVDTGASHSIVKTSWADRLCLLLLPSALSSISAADGRSLSITGSANAAIDLGSARLHALLTVVPDLAYDMVLGVDLLHRLKATVVVHARRLSSPLLLEPVDLFADAASVARAAAVEFTFAAPANPDEDPDLVPLSFMETSSSWDPSNWATLRDRAVVALPFSSVEKARFASTLDRHKAACAADPKAPGLANVEPFRIRTAEAYPIAHRARRFSPAERAAINDEVRRLLTSGIIRPSTSPWAAPIVPVPKPDGSICVGTFAAFPKFLVAKDYGTIEDFYTGSGIKGVLEDFCQEMTRMNSTAPDSRLQSERRTGRTKIMQRAPPSPFVPTITSPIRCTSFFPHKEKKKLTCRLPQTRPRGPTVAGGGPRGWCCRSRSRACGFFPSPQ